MTDNDKSTGAPSEGDELKEALAEGEAEEEAKLSEGSDKTPQERGEQVGEALEAARAEEAANDATPAGQTSDRKTHLRVIIAVVAFAVLLVGAGIAYSALAPQAEPGVEVTGTNAAQSTEVEATNDSTDAGSEGEGANATTPAPDFSMTDAEGHTLKLSDFRGKPVLLNFWASWCGPCASEMPDLQASWEVNREDVQFVIVDMVGMSGETEETAKAFLSENGYTFPVYFDKNSSAAAAFGVSGVPQTYLIDAEGNILGGYMGAMSPSVLSEGISMLTAQN
ncbi:TlpA disulfide reductase family protein [Adlercreutzia equolifaciens]|uniref:TlpA family protein disulfide reductase n=1 Tax=Adlercreutzia equolifaciens TaxID=446660 RepID=UPI0023B04A99|nr:TlpA disulfide reductase family protein [Adlercreutzia equolifaciens]MDE8701886.1 TlpA disulfide reductase family protein [Adlercreutzia equolifaciens]